jgi:hypothetical protein
MESRFDHNIEMLHYAPSAYATWDDGEWFAESFKDCVETGGLLIEQNFPETYKLIDGVMKGGPYRRKP